MESNPKNVPPRPVADLERSVSALKPATVDLVEILISPGHDYWVRKGMPHYQHGSQSVNRATLVAGRGISGDRYFYKAAGHRGQVTLIDWQAIQELAAKFPGYEMCGGWSAATLRRNLVVRGLTLESLVDARFTIGPVRFVGTQECRPCQWMDRMIGRGAKAFLAGCFRGGLRARVEIGGELVLGPQTCVVAEAEPGRDKEIRPT